MLIAIQEPAIAITTADVTRCVSRQSHRSAALRARILEIGLGLHGGLSVGLRGLGGLFCLIDCHSGGEELEVLADAEGLVGFCFMLDV